MKNGVEYFNTIAPHADINLLYTGQERCPPRKHCSGIRSHFLLQFFGSLLDEIHSPADRSSPLAAAPDTCNFFNPPPPQPYYYVEAMKRFIQTNYQKPITVQDVVEYIGVDRSYASRIFRHIENRTLQRYLIEQRMDAAKGLLSERRLSIREVAYSVGYTDYASFERRFKIETGCSPSEY